MTETEIVKKSSLREVTTKGLLGKIDTVADTLLDHMDQKAIEEATLRDKAVAFGIVLEKRQLLMGEPTQILTHEERRNVDDLSRAFLEEAVRRGMVVDVDFHEVPSVAVSTRAHVPIEALDKTAARMAKRKKAKNV